MIAIVGEENWPSPSCRRAECSSRAWRKDGRIRVLGKDEAPIRDKDSYLIERARYSVRGMGLRIRRVPWRVEESK